MLVDVGAQRRRPNDQAERVFAIPYTTANRAFNRAVERAQDALRDAGKDASRLDGYTWHGNRHTLASRLVMAGRSPWSSGTPSSRPVTSSTPSNDSSRQW